MQGASKKTNTAKRNMSSTVCVLSIYSRLRMKLSSFLFVHAGNAAYIIFIMWNSISGLDTSYHFWFNMWLVAQVVSAPL